MPRKVIPVEGIYEREEGSGLWYARFKINGKLVRKSFGRNRAAAVNYVEKARTLRRSGEGIVPDTAKRPVLTIPETRNARRKRDRQRTLRRLSQAPSRSP